MKAFVAVIIVINTIFMGAMAYFSMQTYDMAIYNAKLTKTGIDSLSTRMRSINASLDDKLYGIMSSVSTQQTAK